MGVLQRIREREPALGYALLVAAALCMLAFMLQADVGIGLQDEGFLWYGVERTAHGEVPLRDFRSYDPGRYLWCAAWSFAFGEGLVALRASSALFQFIGLTAGLLACSRALKQRWLLPLAGALLLAWMHPRWKLFDCSLTMIAVWVGVVLLERPSTRRAFCTGACVGLAAFFGRNHGLYTALATGALVVLQRWMPGGERALARMLAAWALGIVAGYLPMLVMLVAVPGFAAAFADSIAFFLGQSALNAPLPVPWPWTIDVRALAPSDAVWAVTFGAWFVALPLLCALACAVLLRALRARPAAAALLASAACVGAPYLHHVFVRADIAHLAQGIHPFLIAGLALPPALGWKPAGWRALALFALLACASALAILPRSLLGATLGAGRSHADYVAYDVGADRIRLPQPTVARLIQLRAQIAGHVRLAELWLPPDLLALYPMLARRSPVWDIYPAWRADDRAQERMLAELADVDWAIAIDPALESEQMLHVSHSYPRVWDLFTTEFERLDVEMPAGHWLLHRRSAASGR